MRDQLVRGNNGMHVNRALIRFSKRMLKQWDLSCVFKLRTLIIDVSSNLKRRTLEYITSLYQGCTFVLCSLSSGWLGWQFSNWEALTLRGMAEINRSCTYILWWHYNLSLILHVDFGCGGVWEEAIHLAGTVWYISAHPSPREGEISLRLTVSYCMFIHHRGGWSKSPHESLTQRASRRDLGAGPWLPYMTPFWKIWSSRPRL